MNSERKFIAYVIILVLVLWAIFPWIAPAYNHNFVLSVQLLTAKVPTYEVYLQNLAPWPTTLTDAQWLVAHRGFFEYWVPLEAPKQVLVLLPFQSYAFQFVIYNEHDANGREYYNGALVLELRATINVLGVSSPIRLLTPYSEMVP